ncbi:MULTISPECIES: TetR family transcriptional regulator [unclassified Solwaraspora]|uniref:TetR/AcrR family transcriptional regulator n=1 Tax=unclassified Solwaraspora TaxID=2627926 RepID=UPI00259BCB3D|nr:TetR family transcriptional regulator [Solwaraspora sp. WMMA2056]WJK38113.1 TetR family transcriptional regulator [Solwaraspora sp. WMMA2056]
MARRTGRRPGNPDTREAILTAARQTFGERGFDQASVRAIAAAAGVDPALVHHYFGTKDNLFLAAMNAPVDPAELLPQAFAGGREEVGQRLVRLVLGVWDSPAGVAALALLRSALSNDWTARLMREFVTTQIVRRVLGQLDLDPAELPLRTALVVSQMAGLLVTRYVLRLAPLSTMAADEVAAAVGPTIQRYLTGTVTTAAPPDR